jgi:hypothetical protein
MNLIQKLKLSVISIIVLDCFLTSRLFATEISQPRYAGLWHFHSSGGYKGYIALDGQGGCSYFISSAAISIEATCVSRELFDDGLMIFGTLEGSSNIAPQYGDQLDSSDTDRAISTNITFQIHDIKENSMTGKLITTGAVEVVDFSR